MVQTQCSLSLSLRDVSTKEYELDVGVRAARVGSMRGQILCPMSHTTRENNTWYTISTSVYILLCIVFLYVDVHEYSISMGHAPDTLLRVEHCFEKLIPGMVFLISYLCIFSTLFCIYDFHISMISMLFYMCCIFVSYVHMHE